MTKPTFTYRMVVVLLLPLALLYTVKRCLSDGGWRYLRQRLGFALPNCTSPVWLHCASVGEANAAAPLAHEIHQRHPGRQLVVTTNTPTGARVVKKNFPDATLHCYLPLDAAFAVARFVARLQPATALIMETEIWPNLFFTLRRRAVPLAIVNARLSRRSLAAPRWLRLAQRAALQQTDLVLARNQRDAQAFVDLGATPSRVRICGNLKFAASPTPPPDGGLIDRPYWLAASTHAPEEQHCARVQLENPELPMLVIVPRHPERGSEIAKQLRGAGVQVAQRAAGDALRPETRIYLADTIGELPRFLTEAAVVFMGGSLIPRGGQNLLEAAHAARPIVIGPHMENFAAETQLLLAAHAVVQINTADELGPVIGELCADEPRRTRLAERASAALRGEADVVERYLRELQASSLLPSRDDA